MKMILNEHQIRQSLDTAKAAFPRFGNWQYNNEENPDYCGFALWGELVQDETESMPRHFFLTFDTYKKKWRGHLTIGQHQYFWSSADFGDANLLGTDECATLEEAIAALRAEIADFFAALQA
jgi:hypothetical protein